MSLPKMYDGVIERAVDGDTFILEINLGWNSYIKPRVRILGIDCPSMTDKDESRKKIAIEATNKAKSYEGKACMVGAYGYDIYGRRLVDLFVDGINYGQLMLANKLADPMRYAFAEIEHESETSVV
jgi:endonuclease YncB( thermonuclease family)